MSKAEELEGRPAEGHALVPPLHPSPLDYRNVVVLAPMVRAGTLPLRLTCLDYGADLVFSEELVDKKLIGCTRRAGAAPGVIEFISARDGAHVFSTCAAEAGRNVLQIGTADAALALQAVSPFARDVAAIDVNMGCPKPFSTHCGMGQGLLSTPELAADIIGTLRRNLPIPITCKIRVLATPAESVEFARRMEAAGAAAVGVHARYKHERPGDRAHWADVTPIVDALRVPVLINGDVFVHGDIARARAATGASSVMIARGA